MRIMHVTDALAIGGKERMLIEIANQSIQSGHSVSVCVTRSDTTIASELNPKIPVRVLCRHHALDLSGFLHLASFVKEQKPTVLHVHGRSSLSFMATAKAMHLVSAPLIFHDHFGAVELDNSIPFWFRRGGRRFVDHYVGVYSKLCDWARESGVPPSHISMIENALDLSRFHHIERRKTGLWGKRGTKRVKGIVTGRIAYEKGVDILLQAFAHSALRDGATIIWIGPVSDRAYYERCLALRKQLDLQNDFLFMGEHKDIPHLLSEADFAVMPSRSESGPLSLIEYMASGLPFVATLVGSIGHRAKELGAQGVVPPEDITRLVASLDDLSRLDEKEWSRRGEHGRELALAHFDIGMVMKQWYELYYEIAAG